MNTGKLLIGTIAGLAIGAALGILFAPEKGSVTRKKISDKGGDYLDGLKTKYDDLKDTVKEQFQNAKEDMKKMVEETKSKNFNI